MMRASFWICMAVVPMTAFIHPIPSMADAPSQVGYSLVWQKFVVKHGEIVQVGTKQLPYPVVLPKSIKPLGNLAEVKIAPDRNIVASFWLFFPTSEDGAVCAWVQTFSKKFPVLMQHGVVDRPFAQHAKNRRQWLYTFRTKGDHVDVEIRAQTLLDKPVFDRYGYDPATAVMMGAWTAPQSPVRNQNGFDMVHFIYKSH